MREFNGRPIELLAPAGTFADFQQVIKSAADAVYLGGKQFNMRMHNPQHNLTNEEIAQAVKIAHDLDKKVYVTFNNMMTDAELAAAESFLRFLAEVEVDALIIQDFGAVKLIRDLGLDLELHLSIMANTHNEEMIAAAKKLGVTRCVVSREASLTQVHEFVETFPEMEYEYFIHGDMCIAHGAQCYASGVFFGKSGNRGLCMKPCRWAYEGAEEPYYPMAVKDMSLYQHIPELILSGINSYKIEGRMRSSEYLIKVINLYGEAIDRFLADPTGYRLDQQQSQYLEENRVRDLSTAYALHVPGINNIALDGKREPRVFSHPQAEPEIKAKRVAKLLEDWQVTAKAPRIRVLVDNEEQALAALATPLDSLYLSGEVLAPNEPFTKAAIRRITEQAKSQGVPVFYGLPRMTTKAQLERLDCLVHELAALGVTGLLCHNLGEINRYQTSGLELRGDYGLNVNNAQSALFYQQQGLTSVTYSIEAPGEQLKDLVQMPLPTEMIVQGSPTLMYMEHRFRLAESRRTGADWQDGQNGNLDLRDARGYVRKIREDQYGKNHLLPTKDFNYVALAPELSGSDVILRIEAKEYEPAQLTALLVSYDRFARQPAATIPERMAWVAELTKILDNPQSLQTLVY